jgi:hypothetical protein
MVNSISGTSGFQFPINSASLTEDQKSQIDSILSKYDPKNMTDEDKQALKSELKSLGIGPGKELFEILKSSGFGPDELRGKGNEGLPPLPANDSREIPQYLLDFIEKQKSGSVTQDDIDALIQNLQNSNQNVTGWFVDKAS